MYAGGRTTRKLFFSSGAVKYESIFHAGGGGCVWLRRGDVDVRSQAGGFLSSNSLLGLSEVYLSGILAGGALALVGGKSPASLTITLVVLVGKITFGNTSCKILRHKTLPLSLRAT